MATGLYHDGQHQPISQKLKMAGTYRSFATKVSQLKMCDFSK